MFVVIDDENLCDENNNCLSSMTHIMKTIGLHITCFHTLKLYDTYHEGYWSARHRFPRFHVILRSDSRMSLFYIRTAPLLTYQCTNNLTKQHTLVT